MIIRCVIVLQPEGHLDLPLAVSELCVELGPAPYPSAETWISSGAVTSVLCAVRCFIFAVDSCPIHHHHLPVELGD